MNLCSDGHKEVCYEGLTCPACEVISDRDYEIGCLKDEISTLEKKRDVLIEATGVQAVG